MDVVEFEAWKGFFGFRYPGGARGPEMEVNDIFFARLMALQSDQKSIPKWRLFPDPETQEQFEARQKAFFGMLGMRGKQIDALKRREPKVPRGMKQRKRGRNG